MTVRMMLALLLVIGPGAPEPALPPLACSYCRQEPAEPGSDLCDGCGLRLERP